LLADLEAAGRGPPVVRLRTAGIKKSEKNAYSVVFGSLHKARCTRATACEKGTSWSLRLLHHKAVSETNQQC